MEDRNLKQEFRRALDAVAPPAPWLTSSVRTTLRERRNERWWDRTRRQPARMRFAVTGLTMAVIAVLVAAAIVIAAMHIAIPRYIPGGLGSNATTSRIGVPGMTSADRAVLAQLEARPLRLPSLNANGSCPPDQIDPTGTYYGTGPVYVHGGAYSGTPWGDFYSVGAWTPPGMTGPVLLRGRDLIAPNHPIVFTGPYATGALVVTDPYHGKAYAEVVLDTRHAPNATTLLNGSEYTEWFWRQGIAAGWSGCIAGQLDGAGFTEDFVGSQPIKNGRDTNYTGG